MKLQRFFIEETLRNKKDITIFDESLIHQLKDVFRLRAGDQLILLDNSGFEYISEVVLLAKGKSELKIVDQSAVLNTPTKEVWLFASLIKKDNYEWILEKCTELGVSHFVPVISDRTEKKDLNVERAHKIIKEASEQSERGIMPTLHDVRNLEDALSHAKDMKLKVIAFHLEGDHFNAHAHQSKEQHLKSSLNLPQEPIGIFIGPEGGWSDKEINLFKIQNIPLFSVGHQVLRAETAAIAIATLFLL
jgi:16S rRNA (uracil1498-N3)-methyltransferase